MKKWIMAIVCLMTMVAFTSCSTYYDIAESEYEVCYPDGTRKMTDVSTLTGKKKSVISVKSYSVDGTNYLTASNGNGRIHIITTTAPIRLNSYKTQKIKKKEKLMIITNDGYSQSLSKKKDDISMSDILSH